MNKSILKSLLLSSFCLLFFQCASPGELKMKAIDTGCECFTSTNLKNKVNQLLLQSHDEMGSLDIDMSKENANIEELKRCMKNSLPKNQYVDNFERNSDIIKMLNPSTCEGLTEYISNIYFYKDSQE